MEQHPVPQNVTTFQFRLIGDMTIKQFGYLAGGALCAFISYKLPLPFFFTWPLTVIFALGGFGFAFVPIEERPMDVWVLSFLKNVYNPTIFHWERTVNQPQQSTATPAVQGQLTHQQAVQNPLPTTETISKTPTGTLQQFFMSGQTPSPTTTTTQQKKFSLFDFISHLFFTNKAVATPAVSQARMYPTSQSTQPIGKPQNVSVLPQKNVEQQLNKTEEELAVLRLQLASLQKELRDKNLAESRVAALQKQLTDTASKGQQTEQELARLRQQMASVKPIVPTMTPRPVHPAGTIITRLGTEPTIKTMASDVAIRAGLPRLTTFPNVVTGITKDYDNNLLPGVLVTVKDKDGIPLRALKTNKLGQFAASTPLPNGQFFIEIEDPRQRFLFDRVQITCTGAVIPALLIVAKSKRQLDREQLQKQIFGSPNANT